MAFISLPVLFQKQRSLVILYLYWLSVSVAMKVVTPGNLTVQTGAKATLSCKMDEQGTVIQVEWSKCGQHQMLVFHDGSGLNVAPAYQDRIMGVTTSGFTIKKTAANDTGDYCCTLTTFPHGTLRGQVRLLLRPPEAHMPAVSKVTTPIIIIIIIIFGALLAGLIAVILFRRRRSSIQNPVHVVIHSDATFPTKTVASPSSSPKSTPRPSPYQSRGIENHNDADDYFNVMSR